MKLIADPVYVPDNASWQTIEDAKAKARWHEVKSRAELMKNTSLDGKCGSCSHFCMISNDYSRALGKCQRKICDMRQRTTKACKFYERKEK